MSKIVTVDEALRNLANSDDKVPLVELPNSSNLTTIIAGLQNQVAGLTFATEALIDLMKVFDVLDATTFQIAYQNVIEYSRSPMADEKVLDIRARALKKKLADYSRSRDVPAESPQAEPAKLGKRQVKKHG